MSLSFWICAAVTAASAYVSLGFSIAGFVGSGSSAAASSGTSTSAAASSDSAARIASRYALARSIALASVATIAFFTGSVEFLAAVAIAMILVQALDAVVGVSTRDRVKTAGPAATVLVNAAVLAWMLAN